MIVTAIFVDDKNWFYNGVRDFDALSDLDMEPDYCTSLDIGPYTVKLFHEAKNIGLTDRYYYKTVLEVYKGDLYQTKQVAETLNIKRPIEKQKDIEQVIKWIGKNA